MMLRFGLKGLIFGVLGSFGCISLAQADYYQIGTNWDKRELRSEDLPQASTTLRKAAKALGRMGGSTSFYIGKFNGKHLMMNNNHDHPQGCTDDLVTFPFLGGRQARCLPMVGTWEQIDTTLFPIEVSPELEAALEGNALIWDRSGEVRAGQTLTTLGYGHHRNEQLKPVYDEGPDCMVLSPTNDFRLKADPDPRYSDSFAVWSFAHGCEASQGDSGSAILDRVTGKVLGILWGTSLDKQPLVQSTAFLFSLLQQPSEFVWRQQLNYAVAAPKLFEVMARSLSVATQTTGVADGGVNTDAAANVSIGTHAVWQADTLRSFLR